MTTYHCEYAWLGGETVERDVAVTVESDRITSVVAGATPADGVRLRGVTLPGVANTHSHAFHRALRSRTHHGEGSFWTWREQMYACAATLDPDSMFALARAVYGEMVLAGYTAVGEFHYVHHAPGGVPYADPNAMGAALVAAATEAGIRLTLLDTCYLHGGIGADLDDRQRRFGDGDALSWATRAGDRDALVSATVRLGAAIHSVRAVEPAEMEIVAAWAAGREAPLHAHVSEQPAENEQCREAYGCSPTELLRRHGVLGERFAAIHATHLDESDIAALGSARSTVALCPTTERDLADGVGPARALADAGAHLAIGSDSHAVIDPFEELRAIELDQRLVTNRRGLHPAPSLLTAGTVDGYASIGWPEGGRIAAGALADLVTLSLDSVRLAGAPVDALAAAVVYAAAPADVRQVMVGGRVVVADGAHARFDVAETLRRVLTP